MRIGVFSAKAYDEAYFQAANKQFEHELVFLETRLSSETAALARDFEAICVFVNDRLDAAALEAMEGGATRLIALRNAGYNNVDLQRAAELGLTVVRVPAYSPHAVAEHVFALLLTLYRTTAKAWNRVRDGNFSLEGLVGQEIHGRRVGIVGTGTIGEIVARLFHAFGCAILAYDVRESEALTALGARYVSFEALCEGSDIITLHCPLLPATHHLIDRTALDRMQRGVTLINTSRGGLVDTNAVYQALKSGHLGYLGIDVYEEEEKLFFEDLSTQIIQDDLFMRLTTFPNVIITGHQAFFTEPALRTIAETTLQNIRDFETSGTCANAVQA